MRKHLKSLGGFWYFVAGMFVVPPLINAIKLFRAKVDSVATVNGMSITQKQFSQVKKGHESYLRQLQAIGLGQFAQRMSDADLLKICAQNSLEQKVADRVGVTVGGEELAEEVAKGVAKYAIGQDGRVDLAQYALSIAASSGMTVAEYEATIMEKMRTDIVQSLVKACSFTPKFYSAFTARVGATKKQFKIIEVPLTKILETTKKEHLEAQELELFFQEHSANYMTESEKTVTYAVIDRELFKEVAVPDEAELEEFYSRVMDTRFADPEKFSVNYAWIEFKTGDEKAAAATKLEALVQEVATSGKSLAKLAEQEGIAAGNKQMFTLGCGELPYALEQEIEQKREVKAVTKVIDADNRVYVAQIEQHKPFLIKSYDEVKDTVFADVQKIKIDQLIRTDMESMITEARETDDGQEVFNTYVEKMQLKKKHVRLKKNVPPADSLEESIAKAVFTQNAAVGFLGYVFDKADLVTFVVSAVKEAEVKPFEQVKEQVKKDFAEKYARMTQESLVARIREKMLAGADPEEELAKFKLKTKTTEWVSADQKEVAGFDFGPKFMEKLKLVDRTEIVLQHKSQDNFYLVQLVAQEISELAEEPADTQAEDFGLNQDIFDGFVASLLKSATIEPNKRMLSDLLPEF
jgi:hypothetical protein